MAVHVCHVFDLVELLLAGSSAVASDLAQDLLLNSSLGSQKTSSCAQKRLEALLGIDDVRVALSLSNAPADLVVLKWRHTVDKGHGVEDGLALLAIVDALEILVLAVDELVIDLLLSLADLLQGSVKQVHHLDVARFDGLGLDRASVMQALELARLGHTSDLVASIVKLFSFIHSEIEVDIAVALQVVLLDLASHKAEDLVLNLVVVDEGLLTHGKPLRHANLPLDLV